jgi:hypothetical protein
MGGLRTAKNRKTEEQKNGTWQIGLWLAQFASYFSTVGTTPRRVGAVPVLLFFRSSVPSVVRR